MNQELPCSSSTSSGLSGDRVASCESSATGLSPVESKKQEAIRTRNRRIVNETVTDQDLIAITKKLIELVKNGNRAAARTLELVIREVRIEPWTDAARLVLIIPHETVDPNCGSIKVEFLADLKGVSVGR